MSKGKYRKGEITKEQFVSGHDDTWRHGEARIGVWARGYISAWEAQCVGIQVQVAF